MPNPEENTRLIELTSRAASINKELLKEEEELITAIKENSETGRLERISDKINSLIRKENLFVGALSAVLKKFKQK